MRPRSLNLPFVATSKRFAGLSFLLSMMADSRPKDGQELMSSLEGPGGSWRSTWLTSWMELWCDSYSESDSESLLLSYDILPLIPKWEGRVSGARWYVNPKKWGRGAKGFREGPHYFWDRGGGASALPSAAEVLKFTLEHEKTRRGKTCDTLVQL